MTTKRKTGPRKTGSAARGDSDRGAATATPTSPRASGTSRTGGAKATPAGAQASTPPPARPRAKTAPPPTSAADPGRKRATTASAARAAAPATRAPARKAAATKAAATKTATRATAASRKSAAAINKSTPANDAATTKVASATKGSGGKQPVIVKQPAVAKARAAARARSANPTPGGRTVLPASTPTAGRSARGAAATRARRAPGSTRERAAAAGEPTRASSDDAPPGLAATPVAGAPGEIAPRVTRRRARLASDAPMTSSGRGQRARRSPVKPLRPPPGIKLPPAARTDNRSQRLIELVEIGRERLGIEDLRIGQDEALEALLAGRDVLAVMPTGSGKSLLYQLPSLIMPGLTVVISPLIALIKDQIDKMEVRGVPVVRIDSTLTIRQLRAMRDSILAPGGKLVLTTPERMADPEFRELLLGGAGGKGVSLFVVDEAHCVSHWGHDFRPSYLSIRKAREELDDPQVLATTATAPPHVRDDIVHQLGMDAAAIITTTFDRPNLHYEVIPLPGDDDKKKMLVTLLKKLPRPGLVYCATVKAVEELYEQMARHGIPVARYHGRLTKKERDAQQLQFMPPKSDLVMIATNAFGLGVDKPDIRYVLHYHVPGSLEAYAQEAGRGGRDGRPSRCVLLFSPDDVAIQEYFLTGSYPSRRQVRAVVKALEAWDHPQTRSALGSEAGDAPPTMANVAIASAVGSQRTRTVLSLLKDEGFVTESEDNLFALSDPPPDPKLLAEKAKQYEARRIADRQRLHALLDYVGAAGCRSQFILGYMGEAAPPPCGRCDNCLRSKEAAAAAAREAERLEAPLAHVFDDDDLDPEAKPKKVIRHRVINIDAEGNEIPAEPPPTTAGPDATALAATPASAHGHGVGDELAALIESQRADAAAEPRRVGGGRAAEQPPEHEHEPPPASDAAPAGEPEDEPEYEYEDDFDDVAEFEDDDDYDYEYVYEDGEIEPIDKTAAALAEEGIASEDAEITILKRKQRDKKQPEPKAASVAAEAQPRKRRRRRRRKKQRALPPTSAFTSPVLASPNGTARTGLISKAPKIESRRSRGGAGGPLVEYVRGSLRINSTPVASATPNDQAGRNKGRKRRRLGHGNGTRRGPLAASPPRPTAPPALAQMTAPAGARASVAPPQTDGGAKKRRRRRRRKGGDGGAGEAPVTFFSVGWPPRSGPPSNAAPRSAGNGGGNQHQDQNQLKKRRRRRRGKRGGAGRGDTSGSTT